ncbi:unnamed protein product [Didymodactylos carnosus]|uniref:Ycf3 n=1 Tax=Didymodactylos carnosus TaxID=1234261 RepID=A0A8S2ELT0_9BILA|nr:unnamed protein product [Didymodactylos carnosus]CAF4065203.1 unnamed protein product [Didymodactylos carnosus]
MDSEPVETKTMLSKITNHVKFYTSEELFLDYIRHQPRSVVLILSGSSAKDILNECHSLQHINSVYIYCMNCDHYTSLTAEYSKIKGIHNKLQDLKISLEEEIAHSTILNFYSVKQNYNRNLTRESASFVWFQLLRNILFKMPTRIYHTDEAKQELLTRCRSYYRSNEVRLKEIDKFNDEYQPENAIREYTKEGFLYMIINQALRTEDIEQLYAFRYYIVDLWLKLVEQSDRFKTSPPATTDTDHTILVYRGIQSNKDEVNKLKMILKDGGLFAPNGFFSTTLRRDVAEQFADIYKERQNNIKPKIIYEIKINLQLQSVVLADVSENSVFNEAEILIGVGVTFKLDEIEERQNDSGADTYLLVKMHATDEGEQIARRYIDEERQEFGGKNETIVFGQLLIKMGEYRKAIVYFKRLLQSLNGKSDSNDNNDEMLENLSRSSSEEENNQRAIIYFSIGDAYLSEGDCERALTYLLESRRYYELLSNNHGIANTLARSASAYIAKQQCDRALENYKQAMELYRQLQRQELNIAFCYNGLGDVYASPSIKDYRKAATCYKRAYDVRKELLSDLNPELAVSYYNMGRLCYLQGDKDRDASMYLYEALKRKEKIYPPYHRSIA